MESVEGSRRLVNGSSEHDWRRERTEEKRGRERRLGWVKVEGKKGASQEGRNIERKRSTISREDSIYYIPDCKSRRYPIIFE